MKLKNEKEIKQQADKEAEEYHPLLRDIDPDKYFVITQSFYEGASWLQQDLLASASDGFEDFCESNTSRYLGLGTFQRELDEKLWQACSLSHTKKMQEKDAEIERLISCLTEILTFKGPEYLKVINGKAFSIFGLVKECLMEERISSFHAGYSSQKAEIKKLQKENEELKKQVELAKNQEYHALTNPWRRKYGEVKSENEELKVKLNTCKNDYWFMINLIERCGTDNQQTLSDCLERMKFRKPMFNS